MFNSITSSFYSAVDGISNTPFVKDVKKGGVFGIVTASIEGIERERLRSEIAMLEEKYKKNNNLQEILDEYDNFSSSFKYRNTVENFRNRMVKHINEKNGSSASEEILYTYVFKLENGKYYVGTTENVQSCYEQHKNDNSNGSINLSKPVEIISQEQTKSKMDEYNTLLDYMDKYGVANVRGCQYQTTNMGSCEAIELQKTLMYLNNKKIKFDEGFILDSTDVATFVMYDFGKFTIDEIAEMRSLRKETVLTHLEKCKKFNVCVV